MKILITGSTGFLGRHVTSELDRRGIHWKGISRSGHQAYKGNIKSWNLGLKIDDLQNENFDALLHMGALYDLRAKPQELRMSNISGTLSALIVARKLGIPRFLNLSSIAAVVNSPDNDVGENELFLKNPFPDYYAETKAFGEQLVLQWSQYFESTFNLRMGILVGNTTEGEILRIDGPYHIPETFRKLKKYIYHNPLPLPLPGVNAKGAPIVPVDKAASAIAEVLFKAPGCKGPQTLHMVPSKGVQVEELYQDSLNFLGLGHKKFNLVGKLPFRTDMIVSRWVAKMPEEEVNYLLKMPKFHTHTADAFLGENWCPLYSDYKDAFWRGYEKFIQNR